MSEHDPEATRRAFFRDSLARVMNPLADIIERRLPSDDTTPYLRPPGAVYEGSFADICRRSGSCIEVCPANAIHFLNRNGDAADGTPVVQPDIAACVVCDGLQCTRVCPSGALSPLSAAAQIKMGLAVVSADTCVRSDGDDCALCVDLCPLGAKAIRFMDGGPPVVIADGCVGCGVCQLHCPTSPKSIVVHPL